ncbi:MAG: hypothetical protein H7144_17180 [Burkholderiales bacterium]|nr:hypothetical protein [Phycisphaerae bacterium]
MSQMSTDAKVLDYQHPGTPGTRHSGLGITALVFAVLTAYPVYVAGRAVYASHRMPGHYFPLLIFSFAFWLVLLGAGIGLGFAIAGVRQKHRRRRIAVVALWINAVYLVALTVMMVLTKGGTESA